MDPELIILVVVGINLSGKQISVGRVSFWYIVVINNSQGVELVGKRTEPLKRSWGGPLVK